MRQKYIRVKIITDFEKKKTKKKKFRESSNTKLNYILQAIRRIPYFINTNIEMTLNITVLISGSGTNLQALIDAQKNNQLKGQITQVISSSETAYGLKRAEQACIPTKTHVLKTYYKGTTKDQTDVRKQRREQFNVELANLLINGQIYHQVFYNLWRRQESLLLTCILHYLVHSTEPMPLIVAGKLVKMEKLQKVEL